MQLKRSTAWFSSLPLKCLAFSAFWLRHEKDSKILYIIQYLITLGFACLFWFFTSQSTILSEWVFLCSTSTKGRNNVSCSRTQHSVSDEARTRSPSISSQALYHWAYALLSLWVYECDNLKWRIVDDCANTPTAKVGFRGSPIAYIRWSYVHMFSRNYQTEMKASYNFGSNVHSHAFLSMR